MAQTTSRTIVLFPSTATTANGTSSDIILPVGFTSVIIVVNVTAVAGTTPTFDLYVQQRFKDLAAGDAAAGPDTTGSFIYDDVAHFAQITATGRRYIRWVGSGNVESAAADAALAAATIRNGPIGDSWRLKYVIGGTTPSFTWTALAQFIP